MTRPTVLSRAVLAVVLAGALPLAGCKEGNEPGQTAAAGEILPRSVTDDMLPYDTVRSQPELAVPDAGRETMGASQPDAAASEGADAEESVNAPDAPDDAAVLAEPITPAAE